MHILKKSKIIEILEGLNLISLIEDGFIEYSNYNVIVPPIGELHFNKPPGDVHIKYGYIIGDAYYVIKIASGFWENYKLGIPNGQGMMLLFCQKTGQPKAILLDDALLTDIRTAIAGQICSKLFSNEINKIGVIGTGLQARMQIKYLSQITDCRQIAVWGRDKTKMNLYKNDMEKIGFEVECSSSTKEIASKCNFIITTTASSEYLLSKDYITQGTHINAIGSDALGKRELGPGLIEKADLVIADSIKQCQERGEISCAIKDGNYSIDQVVELGNILSGKHPGRENDKQITIADLTGVAVQDIQIATAVYNKYLEV